MRWKKTLAFMMVFVFMMSWMNYPVSASISSVRLDCLQPDVHCNYPGEHDAYVWFENDALNSSDISLSWQETCSFYTYFHVGVDFNNMPSGYRFYHFHIIDTLYSGTKKNPGEPASIETYDEISNPFTINTHCYCSEGPEDWDIYVILEALATFVEEDGTTVVDDDWVLADTGWDSSWYSPEIPVPPTPPSVENKIFSHWNPAIGPISNPTVFTAVYIPNPTYTVTYDGNNNTGGTVPVDGNAYHEGDTVTIADAGSMEKTFYTFTGWNDAPDGTGSAFSGSFSMPAENLILYAQWSENAQYTVTYYGNGNTEGTAPADSASPYYGGEEVTLLENGGLGKENYTFSGWNTQSDGLGVNYNPGETFSMPEANVSLFARWIENDKYIMEYNGNGNTGGSAPIDSLSPYYAGENVTVLGEGDLIRTNHTFASWNTQSNGGGVDYSEGSAMPMPEANKILYARWLENPSYTVTYYGNTNNSGTAPVDLESPYYMGEQVIILGANDLAKDYHAFTGWNTEDDGSGVSYNEGDTLDMETANVALYAQWNEHPSYSVTYDGNANDSGTVPVDSSSPYYTGEEVTVLGSANLAKDNHFFSEWNTFADGSGTPYDEDDVFSMASSNVILYAQYVPIDDTLVLEKIPSFDGEEPLNIGDEVTYTFTVTNTGNVTVKGIEITDPLIVINPVPEPFDLEPGQSKVLVNAGTHIINEDDSLAGFFYNEATVTGNSEELDEPSIATGSATVLVQRAVPSLILEKDARTDHEPAVAGDSVTYEFTVTNNGSVTLYDVYVDDAYIGYTSTRVTLGPGEFNTWTLSNYYEITEIDMFNGDIYNEATAYGWPSMAIKPITSTDNATVVVEDAAPAIGIDKSVDDNNVYAGETVTFKLRVENIGNVTLHDVNLTDEILDVSENRESLAPGDWFSIVVAYKTDSSDVPGFENLGIASGWVYEEGEIEATDSDSVSVSVRETPPSAPTPVWIPEVGVTITPDSSSVETGTEVLFTMVVTNEGNTILNNVKVISENLGFNTDISTLFILGSKTFTVAKVMNDAGNFEFTVITEGTSPQGANVSDTDTTSVEVWATVTPPIEPPPEAPPENPQTGAIPFNAYSVSGLITLGAGIFALVTRKKEAEEDEDYDM